jgi:hypothetical protein
MRVILYTGIVFAVLVFVSFSESINPTEAQTTATLRITLRTNTSNDLFFINVQGPTSSAQLFIPTQGEEPNPGSATVVLSPIEPGVYSLHSPGPVDWTVTSMSCNDGSSIYYPTDVLSEIQIDAGDEISCIITYELGLIDFDGDGIINILDDQRQDFSADFNDFIFEGTTLGTIIDRGDQTLLLTEEQNPLGVRIRSNPSGGVVQATIEACGAVSSINYEPQDETIVTCENDVTIEVLVGEVEVTFFSAGGSQANVVIPAVNSITFDADTFSFSSSATNTDSLVIMVNGEEIILDPDSTITMLGTLSISKLTTGGDGSFDFAVSGPTPYNPIIETTGSGEPITLVAPNVGSYGSGADATYYENNIQTDFNIVAGLANLGGAIYQEGIASLEEQGEVRFGWPSQWDFLHTTNSGSDLTSINFWIKGDVDEPGGDFDLPILSTNNPDQVFGDGSWFIMMARDDNLYISISESSTNNEVFNGGFSAMRPPDDLQWHMISVTMDKGNFDDFAMACLDGTLCETIALNNPFDGSGETLSETLTIGDERGSSNPGLENGFAMDDLTIWQGYLLTPTDIATLYNGGLGSSAGETGANIASSYQVLHVTFNENGIGSDGPTYVTPGTYSIQETIPSGWSLTEASCNDGLSSFSGSAVSGIVIDRGDNIECTFENEFAISSDTDGDGILDELDTLPATVSDDFSDIGLGGTTSGTIVTRGDQLLAISEEANPDGVRISADVSGGLVPATLNACGGVSIITLSPGDNIVVTCGSVTIDVVSGPVEVSFIDAGGAQAQTSITAGNSITFDQNTFSFVVPSTNSDPVVVTVDGKQIILNPGQAVTVLSSNKDSFIKQGESNTNEGINTMMRVRDSGNNRVLVSFDQNEMLDAAQERTLQSATLRLYIEENGNNWGPNGRTIDLHRLLSDWAEGNGFNDKPASMTLSQFNELKTRGNGLGVTWKCATDTEINNQQTNCDSVWNGADYNPTPTDTITIFKDNPPTGTIKSVGWIEFDVTADLQAFLSDTEQNYGWIVKKTDEGASGLVEFTSDEAPTNMPELVLLFD